MSLSALQQSQVRSYLNSIWSNKDYMDSHFYPYCTNMPVESWVFNTSPMPQTIVQDQSDTLLASLYDTIDSSAPPPMKDDMQQRLDSSQAGAVTTLDTLQANIVSDMQLLAEMKQCAQALASTSDRSSSVRSCSYPFSSCTTGRSWSTESKSFSCDLNLPCTTLSSGKKVCLLDLPSTVTGNLRVGRNLVVDGTTTIKGAGGADLVRTGSGKVCCGGVPNSTPDSLRDMYNDAMGVLFR